LNAPEATGQFEAGLTVLTRMRGKDGRAIQGSCRRRSGAAAYVRFPELVCGVSFLFRDVKPNFGASCNTSFVVADIVDGRLPTVEYDGDPTDVSR
jgi:hypothetical protein